MYTEIFHTFEGEIEIVFFYFQGGQSKREKKKKREYKNILFGT